MRLPPQRPDKEQATTRFVAAQLHYRRSSVPLGEFFEAVPNHQNLGPISRHSNKDGFRTRPIPAKTRPPRSGWCPFRPCLPLVSPCTCRGGQEPPSLRPYSDSLLGVRFVIDGTESVGDLFNT